jgi:AhpD family alkylhydroperoxidase
MTLRSNYLALGSKAMTLLMEQERYLKTQFSESHTVTITVWELVKLRISQLNQCAFCIDMHSKEAIALGETSERIIGLSAWRDMPLYAEIERVALGFAEHLTLEKSLGDKSYSSVVEALGEQAVVDLTIAINAINSWNRLVKTFKPEVGSFV